MKLKIIKSLLIPTLGITLSATTISSLTSCTNNSEIKKNYLIGGSTQLSGIEGKVGSDTKSWQLSIDGNVITENIDWAINNPFDDEPIDGISIEGGIVSWSDNIAAGEYYFFVIATYDGLHITSRGLITLDISQYILDGGSVELNGVYGKAGSDTKSWQLSIDESIITENINWGLEANNGAAINGISINGGIVSWVANMNTGEYYFYVIATYDGIKIKSPQIKLTIGQYILDGGSVELNGAYGKAESDTKSWQLSLDGKIITDNIDWELENSNGAAINGISINGGIVSWVANMNTGEYYFYVIATYDGLKVKSPQIKLTIGQYILDSGSVELNGIHNHDGQDQFSWRLLLNGTTITNNFIWGLESDNNDAVNDNIHIISNAYMPYFANVSWSGNIAIGDYYFYVIATYDGLKVKSTLIHLAIS